MRRNLFHTYVWGRQSIAQIAVREKRSPKWVRKQLDGVVPVASSLVSIATPIAADMTFWGRGYGVVVFRSPTLKKNLWWHESFVEAPWVYAEGLASLRRDGWIITGVVIDGRRGVAEVFERHGIPVQHCQFHQIKTVTKYLTRKPKTEAGRTLRALTLTLSKTREATFTTALAAWHGVWEAFLNEKTQASHRKRGWIYTHQRIRAAYRSLTENLPRLFMYQKYPDLRIPNTTNTLDGMFSQIKNRLAVHRGLRRDRRYKVITEILGQRRKSDTTKDY